MKVVCLTGGIASGKSTASHYLQERGAQVIDADKLGHRAYEPGTSGHLQVMHTFGKDIVGENQQIDRKALGAKVFGQPKELKKLISIVWPEIRKLAEAEIAAYRASEPDAIVILEAAVLFEAGWQNIGDEVWVIVVERDVAIARTIARGALDRQAVEKRLDSQLSNAQRTAQASVVIDNSGTLEAMQAQLDQVWRRLTS